MCVDERTGLILGFDFGEEGESYTRLAIRGLDKAANQLRGLPRQIQLRDPAVASELKEALTNLVG